MDGTFMRKTTVYNDVKKTINLCKNEISNKCYDSILEWSMSETAFSKFSQCYQFTNEAIDDYYKLLNLKDKKVLTVCGSGDQVIYAMMQDAKKIDVFDSNKITYYYLFLKISAIIGLDYREFLDLMNLYSNDSIKLNFYKKIRDLITQEDVKIFWDLFFKEKIDLFPTLFIGDHNNIGVRKEDWLKYLELMKVNIYYLNEDLFYHTKNKLKCNNSSIHFECTDMLKVTKCFNDNYDFINCSNIIDYINDQATLIKFFKEIINNNLNKDGMILLNYYWNKFSTLDFINLQELINALAPNISVKEISDIYTDSILTYKK